MQSLYHGSGRQSITVGNKIKQLEGSPPGEYELNNPKFNGAPPRHKVIGHFLSEEKAVNSIKYLDMLELSAVPQMTHLQPQYLLSARWRPSTLGTCSEKNL
jgi:hypothetical protein